MEKIVINVKRLKVFRKKACLNVFFDYFCHRKCEIHHTLTTMTFFQNKVIHS